MPPRNTETFEIGHLLGEEKFSECRAEGIVEATGEPWYERPTLLFYAGRHKGRDYTEQDLDDVVEQFHSPIGGEDWEAPSQVDHSDSARDTIGHPRRVWRDGKELFGILRFIGEEPVRKAKNGLWRRVSAGFTRVNGRLKLDHVGITPFPALTRAATFDDRAEEPEEKDDDMPDMPKKEETKTVEQGQQTEGQAKDDKVTETKPEEKQEFTRTIEPAAGEDALAAMREEFARKTQEWETRMAAVEAENMESKKKLRFSELTRMVDTFSEPRTGTNGRQSVKTVPAMRDAELKLLETFSDEQLDLYKKLKETQPDLVVFDVIGDRGEGNPSAENFDAEAERLSETYFKKK
ncbi:MAG: hypothetical protein AB7S38_28975 [Vulcanimicrobiota bacterium]